MEQDHNKKKGDPVYSLRLRAGKRRTYFFDVRPTRSDDFYITITESKKRYDDNGYERHKLFLYKEDFNKFMKALEMAMDHVKEELMPDYDFDEFTRDMDEESLRMTQAIGGQENEEEAPQVREEQNEDIEFEVKYEVEESASNEENTPDEGSEEEKNGESPEGEEAEKW